MVNLGRGWTEVMMWDRVGRWVVYTIATKVGAAFGGAAIRLYTTTVREDLSKFRIVTGGGYR
eukprot:scaffold5381_cov76-Skeletonema_dohrnii-CCMP3373.AAC.3